MIIGLTGTFGAGKDAASEYLEKKGFEHYSTADILREEAAKRELNAERETLRQLKNQLAETEGDDYLAKKAVERAKSDKVVISAIRSVGEVDYLKSLADFTLIFVDAPIEIRFERIKNRRRAGEEKLTLESFKEKEMLEMSGASSQRIDYAKEKADYLVDNSGSLGEFHQKIDQILEKIADK